MMETVDITRRLSACARSLWFGIFLVATVVRAKSVEPARHQSIVCHTIQDNPLMCSRGGLGWNWNQCEISPMACPHLCGLCKASEINGPLNDHSSDIFNSFDSDQNSAIEIVDGLHDRSIAEETERERREQNNSDSGSGSGSGTDDDDDDSGSGESTTLFPTSSPTTNAPTVTPFWLTVPPTSSPTTSPTTSSPTTSPTTSSPMSLPTTSSPTTSPTKSTSQSSTKSASQSSTKSASQSSTKSASQSNTKSSQSTTKSSQSSTKSLSTSTPTTRKPTSRPTRSPSSTAARDAIVITINADFSRVTANVNNFVKKLIQQIFDRIKQAAATLGITLAYGRDVVIELSAGSIVATAIFLEKTTTKVSHVNTPNATAIAALLNANPENVAVDSESFGVSGAQAAIAIPPTPAPTTAADNTKKKRNVAIGVGVAMLVLVLLVIIVVVVLLKKRSDTDTDAKQKKIPKNVISPTPGEEIELEPVPNAKGSSWTGKTKSKSKGGNTSEMLGRRDSQESQV